MLGGPQGDRSRMFEGASGKEDILAPERGSFEGESTRLRRENGILKDQLQRALKELKAYQAKYPSAYISVPQSDGDELPPWASSPDIMSPLFEVYDSREKELKNIVSHQSEQLKAQTANVRSQCPISDRHKLSFLFEGSWSASAGQAFPTHASQRFP